MMAGAAAKSKRLQKKRQTKKAKAVQQKRREHSFYSLDTDTDTATRASHMDSVDNHGYDSDKISYSKKQPFNYQGGADQAMEQD